jgi:hypothetical protein
MQKGIDFASGIALFLAGMATGLLSNSGQDWPEDWFRQREDKEPPAEGKSSAEPADPPNSAWKAALADMERRMAAQEAQAVDRFSEMTARLDGQAAKLAELPTISQIEERIAAREAASAERFGEMVARLDKRLDEHAARLAEVPTTPQIVSAMEQMLSKTMAATMASLDERLTTQARSIEVLTTTVSQTDNLLEKVLESLDTLQSSGDSPEPAPAAESVAIQKAGEMPQSVRSSVEYVLGRSLGPEEEVSIAAAPRQQSASGGRSFR